MEPPDRKTDDRPVLQRRSDIWRRLTRLLGAVEKNGVRGVSAEHVEELGQLYRATCSHLELQRAFGISARRRDQLNRLVARGHAVLYGRDAQRRSKGRGFLLQLLMLPVTFRRSIHYHAAAAALLLAGGVYGYLGAEADPEWSLNFVLAGDDRTPYATHDELLASLHTGREGEVDVGQHASFAAQLWWNNTRVALLAFFSGFLAGIPTALLDLFNGVLLGSYTYTFHAHGLGYEWWAWILPHGVTELLGVVLLSGGGLWIGHMIVAPGETTRMDRLRARRGDLARLALLAFPMMFAAALFESFVRQSPLDDATRYQIAGGTALFWIVVLGFVGPTSAALTEARRGTTHARRRVDLPTTTELL